ncbi:ATPase, T2SS/T4P/T4SS family [Streptomyces bohaiensis]|uniref:Flp pilus assembly complex ATPase component TadA n=1 Tax=Streptomyces bohaiensis TaxID=1431344 RepID=A0ABX1C923_9ACTN|nr:ATPase, T2SS/T4P/T4SS family [Streptomyces bohaiensis]NJQ15636.1 Flp pilus assembly complex ATPase component TadA [Streptomyces bohaiensis]
MGLRSRLAAPDEPTGTDQGDSRLVAVYRAKLLQETDLAEMSAMAMADRRDRLERVLGHILSREGPVLSTQQRAGLIRRVVDEALGLGILEPLLEDTSITEIMVNGPDQVFVERDGRVEQLPLRFASNDQLMQTIERIVSTVNRRVDESNPMVDARLPTGERVNVIIPPLSLSGATLTIRRFPRAFSLGELLHTGTLDQHLLVLLTALVRARCNIIVSGGTGSGKTTLLNALSGLIPEGERIVTVEDAAELQLQQRHVVRLEARPPNVEGRGEVTIRDLVRNSLRMRPDRILVGEVRGGETLDMLQAMSTGHDGSLATVHANSAEDALLRLQTLASMSELQVPFAALRDQINSAVDVLVQLTRHSDGTRRISEVAVLASRGQDPFHVVPVTRFHSAPFAQGGAAEGRFVHHPVPRALAERLHQAGESVPPVFGVLPDGPLPAPYRTGPPDPTGAPDAPPGRAALGPAVPPPGRPDTGEAYR